MRSGHFLPKVLSERLHSVHGERVVEIDWKGINRDEYRLAISG